MVVDSDMILCEQGLRLWVVVLCVRGCKEYRGIASIEKLDNLGSFY